jgi:hypothetical protein
VHGSTVRASNGKDRADLEADSPNFLGNAESNHITGIRRQIEGSNRSGTIPDGHLMSTPTDSSKRREPLRQARPRPKARSQGRRSRGRVVGRASESDRTPRIARAACLSRLISYAGSCKTDRPSNMRGSEAKSKAKRGVNPSEETRVCHPLTRSSREKLRTLVQ